MQGGGRSGWQEVVASAQIKDYFLGTNINMKCFNLEKLNWAEFSLFSVETLLQSGRERRQV